MSAKHSGNGWRRSQRRSINCVSYVLIWIASVLVLSSCATGTKPIPAPSIPSPPPPEIPVNLRQHCPALPLLQSSDPNPFTVLAQHDQEAALYRDCRSSKAQLIQATDEWQATAWRWYCQAVKAAGTKVKDCPSD